MKNATAHRLLGIACLLAIAIAPRVSAAPAPPREPKSVADFFLLVPEKYLPYDLRFREELLRNQHRRAIIDVRNGFIAWDASDAPDAFEFVLFRKSNGSYLVAYNDLGDDFDGVNGDSNGLMLLSYESGKWHDVTGAMLPASADKSLVYKLPRQGKTIEVSDEERRRLYTLTWTKDRFSVGPRTENR
jgi:hypothetical protein